MSRLRDRVYLHRATHFAADAVLSAIAFTLAFRLRFLDAAGGIPHRYVVMLAIVGREVGDRWDQWRSHLHYVDYAVIAAIAIAIGYLIVRRRRRGRAQWEPSPPA